MSRARFEGKVALVTGAARGQGEEEARRFVAEGAQVVITDVLDAELDVVAKELGDAALALHHDVSSESEWADVVTAAVDRFGQLDVLVNNAAIHHIRPIEHERVADFERVLAVNLTGTFLGIRSVIEPMRAGGGGSIVNISSLAGLQGYFGHAAYSASKCGVIGVTKSAAIELGPTGIRVNSIHPGAIDTAMLPGGADGEGRFDHVPLQRVGTVAEIADLVLFLASDDAGYVTGSQLTIDGGLLAGNVPPGR
jgi:3alpha(or 20beta)-hydroxysteroid dehydrogenase